jgi:hypothetical protein
LVAARTRSHPADQASRGARRLSITELKYKEDYRVERFYLPIE